MKALIVFETTHGCTEKCALMLKEKLSCQTDIVRLRENPDPDISSYHTVIVGGSIHTGMMSIRVRKFCKENLGELITKTLGLYICCMHEGEAALRQFEEGFPEELRSRAKASGVFGGEFNFGKMNVFEKTIVKKIAKVDKSVSRIREDEVSFFAEKMNKSQNA